MVILALISTKIARLLTKTTIEELKLYVPGSEGTQLYLQAAIWTRAPYRNDKFGSPPNVAKSLWAGIMTWRCWWQYILITLAYLFLKILSLD